MAKFAFVCVPAFGHFNPTLPIIAELVRRGHQVTVINSGEFAASVEAVGAHFQAFPVEFSSRQLAELLVNGNLGRTIVFAREAAMVLVPWLNVELSKLSPDCLVYDAHAIFGHISGKMLRLKSASIFPHPVIEATRQFLGWRNSLQAMRQNGPYLWKMLTTRIALSRRFGASTFPATRPRFQSRGDISVMLTIPEMQRSDAWRDETMIYVGPSIDESVRGGDFDFARLDGRPLVYISLGTLATGDIEFYRTCLSALANVDVQFLLSIGQRHTASDLGNIPHNFIVEAYVPQLEILKRAALFVTHAGANSLHEGLWYGVPMVAIPQQIEQLMNAKVAAGRGACVIIDSHFMVEPVTGSQLLTAVEKVLADPSYRQGARGFQAALRKSGGFRQAAAELEKFAAQRSPGSA